MCEKLKCIVPWKHSTVHGVMFDEVLEQSSVLMLWEFHT